MMPILLSNVHKISRMGNWPVFAWHFANGSLKGESVRRCGFSRLLRLRLSSGRLMTSNPDATDRFDVDASAGPGPGYPGRLPNRSARTTWPPHAIVHRQHVVGRDCASHRRTARRARPLRALDV